MKLKMPGAFVIYLIVFGAAVVAAYRFDGPVEAFITAAGAVLFMRPGIALMVEPASGTKN